MNYQIQGLSIHAEVHGTAEPAVVFLHYWGGTSRTWRKVTAELEGQFKTVAYDARGWGNSDKTLAGYRTMRDRRNNPDLRRCFGSLGVVSSVPHLFCFPASLCPASLPRISL